MPRLILSLTLWLAAAAQAAAQVDFSSVCTPKQRVEALRAAYAAAKPGDTLNVPAGIYADTKFPAFPAGVTVKGAGRGKTVFQSPDPLVVTAPNAFALQDGSVVESLTMQTTAPKNTQSVVCGINGDQTAPRSAVIRDCEVLDGCWGIYCWVSTSPKLRIENCFIRAARVGIVAGNSSGAAGQYVDIVNTKILMDPSLSTQGGSVSHAQWGGVCGVLCRGGLTKINDLTVEATGAPAGLGPRLVAVSDWLDLGSSTATVIEVSGLKTKLTKGGAEEVFDIDVRYGTLRFGGSLGTGKLGSLSICPLPPLKPAAGGAQ